MEQNTGQQRLKQSHFSSSKYSLQYTRKIQVENLEESLYICLVQLRRSKVQLLQEYNRQFSRKGQIELQYQCMVKNRQKQIMLRQFERQHYEKSKERMKEFVLCDEGQSAGVLKNHRELNQRLKELEEKQRRRKQQIQEKEKTLKKQKEFTARIQKDIKIIENKIEKGESETFEQEKALYQKKIQELELKLQGKLLNSKKVDQLMLLRQQGEELRSLYNELMKETEFTTIQYESDPDIAQKMRRISEDARIKQSIEGQLVHFIEKGVNLTQENQILSEFLQLNQELQKTKKG